MEYLYYYLAAMLGGIFALVVVAMLIASRNGDEFFYDLEINKLKGRLHHAADVLNRTRKELSYYRTNLAYTEEALRTIEAVNAKYLRTASELDDKAANLPSQKTDKLNERFISIAFNKDWLPVMLATNPEAVETYSELLSEVSKCENCGGSGDIELPANPRSIEPRYTSCRKCGGSGAIV